MAADDFAGRITADNVEIFALGMKTGHDWGVYWKLLRVLIRLKPRIIHTRNLAALEMQAVGWLIPGARGVHGEHGRDIYDLDGSNRRYQILRRLLSPIIGRFITVSEDLRGWLVDTVGIPAKKVVQIYNGVDTARFYPRATADWSLAPKGFAGRENLVIGTVGRLAEVKNQDALVSAFAKLVTESPTLRSKLRLVIVGDGPMHDALQRSIKDKGISELVWLTGNRSDIPELLAMLDIFVLSSLAEGVSNTILEAMASGLPILATRTGGNPELVRDGYNGWLVPVSDSDALAERLRHMLENMAQTRELGARGREMVDATFNWDRTVDRYFSVYDELLTAR